MVRLMFWSNPLAVLALGMGVFLVSLSGTRLVLHVLAERAIVDHPNARSSHVTPTPRGGGLAVIAVLAIVWTTVAVRWSPAGTDVAVACAAGVGLAVLSWLDDLRGLPPWLRLLGQAAAIAAVLILAPASQPYFGGVLPPLADAVVAAILWIWFTNLFNFMDGIDGLAGTETTTIGIGVALCAGLVGLPEPLSVYGFTAAAAALGFRWWNWHPARVFLGDVGSVPLGFLLGWLLLTMASDGLWAAALILPLYFLADATITLVRRAARGEAVWRPHRDHFYQRAVRAGRSHAAVSGLVAVTNVVLIALAWTTTRGWEWPAVAAACVVVGALLYVLDRDAPVAAHG